MGCNRGRATPNTNTQRQLFASSGGYCQNPGCNQPLFIDAEKAKVSVAEMAHIYAAEDDGPRPNADFTPEERGAFDNLILLCANCHTVIDKAPDAFPDTVISRWKSDHESRIAGVFGAIEYASRGKAREALLALTARTGSIHRRLNPDRDYKWNPEADEANEWKYHVRETIIPTNRSLLSLLDRNRGLLVEDEVETVEIFRQHIEGVERRHIFDAPLPSAPLYPPKVQQIFRGADEGERS